MPDADYFPELDASQSKDFFPELNQKTQAAPVKASSATEDHFPELDKPEKKQESPLKGFLSNAGKSIKAAASAVPTGFGSLIEQPVNAAQYAYRHIPFPLNNALILNQQPFIDAANKSAAKLLGTPVDESAQSYMDVTGEYNRTHQGWLGGQTPTQAQAGHPYASMAGNLVGGLPLMLGGGEAEAALPLAGKIAKSAGIGSAYGAGFGGLDEAASEAKNNDTWDPSKIGQTALINGLAGGALGAGAGALGGLFGKKPPVIQPTEESPKLLPYNRSIITPPPPDASGINVRHGQWEQPQPKLLPYNKNAPLIPPGPTEQLRQRGDELFGQPQKGISEELKIEPKAKGKISKTETLAPQSWREAKDIAARAASPEESRALRPLAKAKVDLDQAAAKLEGALREADPNISTRSFKKKTISPDDYRKVQEYIAKHSGKITKLTEPYVEATLAEGDQFLPVHKFQTDNPVQELKDLHAKFVLALDKYEAARTKAGKQLPLNEMVQASARDAAGQPRAVNMKLTQQAAPRSIKFPTPELQKGFQDLKASLYHDYPEQFWSTFDRFIEKELPKANATIQEALGHLPKSTQAKVLLTIGLSAAYLLSQKQKAEAEPEVPPTLVGKVVKALKKVNWDDAQGFRPITRITGTQLTSDIIRQGFDPQSRSFAKTRDLYLAALRRTLANGRHLTEVEEEALAKEGPNPNIMTTPVLNGWTTLQREKLARTIALHKNYSKQLKAEIARMEKLGVNPKGLSLFGKERYGRALHLDLNDMQGTHPVEGGIPGLILDKFTGSGISSIFYGNYRASTMHILEATIAFGSRHPKASIEALHGLATDPVYRKFAEANSPRGMFQQVLESQGSMVPFIDRFNDKIDNAIKALPGGEILHGTISAQLPERAKLGLGATITAQENARSYPGGPRQYMSDWLANSDRKSAVPRERQAQFTQIELKNFIEENKAIMSMPDGPIKERTMFQRHGSLIAKSFPFLRAITQQTRFFAGLIDDAIAAVRTGDRKALANSIKALLIGHVMVASIAGSHVMPDYIWSILESIDKDDTDKLRDLIDDSQKVMSGGYQMQDFGVKWLPYLKARGMFISDEAERILRGLATPKDKPAFFRSLIDLGAISIINRVGPEGTMNLDYLWERLSRGMAGYERYVKYTENPIEDKAMGRPFAQKLVDKKLPFDIPQALAHWLLKIENPGEVQANKQAEQKGQKLFQKDLKKVENRWQNIAR